MDAKQYMASDTFDEHEIQPCEYHCLKDQKTCTLRLDLDERPISIHGSNLHFHRTSQDCPYFDDRTSRKVLWLFDMLDMMLASLYCMSQVSLQKKKNRGLLVPNYPHHFHTILTNMRKQFLLESITVFLR